MRRFRIKKALRVVYFAGFFFSAHVAFTTYINSTFISSIVGEKLLGLAYSLSAVIIIAGLIAMPRYFNIFGAKRTILCLLLSNLILLLGLSLIKTQSLSVLFFITYLAVNTLTFFGFDLLVESNTENATTGNARGLYLTIINSAWVVAPFLAGMIAGKYGFGSVYAIAFFISLAAAAIILLRLKAPKIQFKTFSFGRALKQFFGVRDLRRIIVLNFLLQFFYSWMVIYIPIYLNRHVGLGWNTIGFIFVFMLLPFVLFEFPLGRLADKKLGEKELLSAGFVIAGIMTACVAFVKSDSVALWAAILFGTRVGASMIEVMSESYFFKKVDVGNVSEISIFRDTSPLAYIIGPLVATALLQFIQIEYLFLVLGAIMVLGFTLALRIKDTL